MKIQYPSGMRRKAESLTYTSVGHRPTYGAQRKIKAESLAPFWMGPCARLTALKFLIVPLRRAMPYASMCKGFALNSQLETGNYYEQ